MKGEPPLKILPQEQPDLPEEAEVDLEPYQRGILFRRPWLSISLGALLLCALIFIKPLYHLATGERARWLAGSAISLNEQGHADAAIEKATAAFQLKPDEPATWRAMAKVLAPTKGLVALAFWRRLIHSPAASLQDCRDYVETAIAWRQTAAASDEIQILLTSDPNSAINNLLAAKLHGVAGDRSGALAYARRAHDLDPSNPEITLVLASVLVAFPGSEHDSGMDLLWKAAAADTLAGLEAVTVLSRQNGLTGEDQDRIIARLEGNPLTDETHRLLALDMRLRRDPEHRESLLDAEQSRYGGEDGEHLRQFGSWLNAHGEYARIAQVIPLKKALLSKDLLLVYLDALASQNKWSEIAGLLQQANLPLEDAYIDVFLSRAYSELGDPRTSDAYWRRATADAAYNAEQGFFVAGYAEKLGQSKRAEDAYRTLTQKSDTARPAYDALLRLSIPKGTHATLAVLKEMHQRWPDDAAVSNDCAYMELLVKENIADARSQAEDLCAKYPDRLPHRTTLALAWLRSGQPASALQVYAGLNVNWTVAPASSATVYAAVLNANGRSPEALHIAAAINRELLRPEETELLQFAR